MRIEKLGRLLPYTCDQIFDLAAHVERYPEFLRWWISARVVRREGDTLHVDQVLGFGPARLHFQSTAVLKRPERIDVSCSDPMFRKFGMSFVVLPRSSGGCCLNVIAELEMRSLLRQVAVGAGLSASVDEILAGFEARAHVLYGRH
jgi:coenzyme Q-binding protein COQ10